MEVTTFALHVNVSVFLSLTRAVVSILMCITVH